MSRFFTHRSLTHGIRHSPVDGLDHGHGSLSLVVVCLSAISSTGGVAHLGKFADYVFIMNSLIIHVV